MWCSVPRMLDAVARRPTLVLGAVLVAVVVGASSPGLLGDWVYDDISLAENRSAYDSLDDIPQVAVRDSSAYLDSSVAKAATDRTYRPTTELTLVAVQVLAPQPWLHHLVGLLLHLTTTLCLYFAMKRAARAEFEVGPAFVAALFALHPVGAETWVYINGRSDLVAGCLLVGLALVLRSHNLGSARTLLAAALLAFFGAGAKETFCVAAPVLALSEVFTSGSAGPRRRAALRAAGAIVVGTAIELGVRAWLVPVRPAFASGTNVFTDTGLVAVFGKAVLVACDHLLFLRAEPMFPLASLTVRGPSLLELLAGAATLGLVLLAVRARDFRAVVLVAGALLVIAPTVVVSRAVWLGFDRYLYMSMILVALAAGPHLQAFVVRLSRPRAVAGGLGALVLVAAALMTWIASSSYSDQETFENALLSTRPDDSVGFAYVALQEVERGRPAVSAAVVAMWPEPPWPEAVILPLMVTARRLGDRALLDRAVRYGQASYPESTVLRAHAMVHYYGLRDDAAAARLARSFTPADPPCLEVGRQVATWARSAPEPRRALWRSVAREMRCRGSFRQR